MDLMQQTDTQDEYIEQIDVAQTIAFDPRTAEYYVGLEDPGQSRKNERPQTLPIAGVSQT